MSRTTDREIFRDLWPELHQRAVSFARSDSDRELAACIPSRTAALTAREILGRARQPSASLTTKATEIKDQFSSSRTQCTGEVGSDWAWLISWLPTLAVELFEATSCSTAARVCLGARWE